VGASAPLGHLPAEVSKWLAPLLAGGFVALSGVVMEDPVSPKAPVLVSITVCGDPLHAAFHPRLLCAERQVHALSGFRGCPLKRARQGSSAAFR